MSIAIAQMIEALTARVEALETSNDLRAAEIKALTDAIYQMGQPKQEHRNGNRR